MDNKKVISCLAALLFSKTALVFFRTAFVSSRTVFVFFSMALIYFSMALVFSDVAVASHAASTTLNIMQSNTTNTTTMPKTFNWTGAYAGGFAGMAARSNVTTTAPLRIDNNANWFRPFNDSFSFNTRPSFIGGITIGYNWKSSITPFLLGLEGEYGYLNLRGSSVDPNQFPYANIPNNNLQNSSENIVNIGKPYGYALIGVRVGYVMDRVLFYIKSGVVFTSIQSEYTSVKTEDRAPAYLNLSGTKRTTGYGIGGGIEYALPFEGLSNFSTKIEYLFLGINKEIDVYGHCSCNFLWRTTERIRGVNTIKIGLNYKFQ